MNKRVRAIFTVILIIVALGGFLFVNSMRKNPELDKNSSYLIIGKENLIAVYQDKLAVRIPFEINIDKDTTVRDLVANKNEEEVLKTIKDCYEDNGYVLDTHTACGYGVLKQYQKETGDQTKTILLSTASPYKFPESVYKALFNEELDVYDAIEKLNEKTGVAVPKPLAGIKDREVLHKTHIDKTEIINFIKSEMEGL